MDSSKTAVLSRAPSANSNRNICILSTALFAFLCARSLLYNYVFDHRPFFQDDAYYYLVVARHLVQTGRSSFDGLTLTNGYHPLWMAMLVLLVKLSGSASTLLIRCLEYALGAISLVTVLLTVRLPNALLNLIFTVGYFYVLSSFCFSGMETTVLACCFGLFTYFSGRGEESIASGIIDGLLATAVIAARIDAALFIIPQMVLAARSWPRRLSALGVVLALGLIYAGLNIHYFGIAVPVSGQVKALGGLQINHLVLHVFREHTFVSATLYGEIFMFLLSLVLLRHVRNRSPRAVTLAYIMGFPIFILRMVFLSSWTLWSWYDYPLMFAYVGIMPAILFIAHDAFAKFLSYRTMLLTASVLFLLHLANSSRHLLRPGHVIPSDYFAITEKFLNRYGSTLDGSPLAMGDRAGYFAWRYPGSVDQLEGIMNDKQYFDVLAQHGDIKALLCQRGIRYVVSYEPDLGNYDTHQVETIRPHLSQFAAARIEVRHADELGKFSDPAEFDASGWGDFNSTMYLWRLHCDTSSNLAGSQ